MKTIRKRPFMQTIHEKERILLVDDEELNLEILTEFLSAEDFNVIPVTSGKDALEFLKVDDDVDLIVLDKMMPEIDGMEVLRFLKQETKLSNIPVILQTAVGGDDAIAEGIKAGAYYYLTKPFKKETLLAVVNSALEISRITSKVNDLIPQKHGALALLESGQFKFQTIEEAQQLATLVAQYAAEPEKAIKGVAELLINAVEHGNLQITIEGKADLLLSGKWHEEVSKRLSLEENKSKYATMNLLTNGDELEVRIKDMGKGFDWNDFLQLTPERATLPNGRGITMARQFLKDVKFEDNGSSVTCIISRAKASVDSSKLT